MQVKVNQRGIGSKSMESTKPKQTFTVSDADGKFEETLRNKKNLRLVDVSILKSELMEIERSVLSHISTNNEVKEKWEKGKQNAEILAKLVQNKKREVAEARINDSSLAIVNQARTRFGESQFLRVLGGLTELLGAAKTADTFPSDKMETLIKQFVLEVTGGEIKDDFKMEITKEEAQLFMEHCTRVTITEPMSVTAQSNSLTLDTSVKRKVGNVINQQLLKPDILSNISPSILEKQQDKHLPDAASLEDEKAIDNVSEILINMECVSKDVSVGVTLKLPLATGADIASTNTDANDNIKADCYQSKTDESYCKKVDKSKYICEGEEA